jgi:RNA polymerase sigma-70 factor (ECF subfamily)
VDERDLLAEQFEEKRAHLRRVAYRMLGSQTEADDAVQEAWLKVSRSGTAGVENLGGWLTTIVARVCLDILRARKSRREDALDAAEPAPIAGRDEGAGPEQDVLLADSVGVALLIVLEALAPAERVAFVLHDMFDLPFDEIAPIVGRSPEATRQLASRARRRVQGTGTAPDADITRKRTIVDAFLAASRNGDFNALLAVLDPDVVLKADRVAVAGSAANPGAPRLAPEVHGAATVATAFSGRAKAAQLALLDGMPGAVWAPGGTPRVAFAFTIEDDRIVGIEIVADPDRVHQLEVTIFGD